MVWCRSAVLSLSFFCAGRGRAAAVGTEWRRGCSWRRTVSVITTAEPSKEAFRHTSAPPSPSRALTAGPSTGSSSSLVPRTSVVTMASKPPTSRSSCSWPAFAINDAVKEPRLKFKMRGGAQEGGSPQLQLLDLRKESLASLCRMQET